MDDKHTSIETPWNDRCPECRADAYMTEEFDDKTYAVELVCAECGNRILKGFGRI